MAANFTPYPPCSTFLCSDRECCGTQQKYDTVWPNLVGMAAEEAKAIITKDNPLVTVVLVHRDEATIDNFCCNRVWLFVDESNRVRKVPMVG
ncbi:hypothetical protein ACP275_03G055900 [Erythranthe tilingii]